MMMWCMIYGDDLYGTNGFMFSIIYKKEAPITDRWQKETPKFDRWH